MCVIIRYSCDDSTPSHNESTPNFTTVATLESSFFLFLLITFFIFIQERSTIDDCFNCSISSIGFHIKISPWTCKLISRSSIVSLEGTSKHWEDYDHWWSHWMRDEWFDGGCSNSHWAWPCWDTSKNKINLWISIYPSTNACQSLFFYSFFLFLFSSVLGDFSGIIGQNPCVSKSIRLYVHIFWFLSVNSRYIPYGPLKRTVIFQKSWTSTAHF